MKMKTGCSLVGILLLAVIQLAATYPPQTEVEEVPLRTAEAEDLTESGGTGYENANIISSTTGAENPTESIQSNPTNQVQATEQSNPSTMIDKPHKTTLLTSMSSGSSSNSVHNNRPLSSFGGSGFMSRPFGSSQSVNQLFKHGGHNRPSLFANSPSNQQPAMPSDTSNNAGLVQPLQTSSSKLNQWKLV